MISCLILKNFLSYLPPVINDDIVNEHLHPSFAQDIAVSVPTPALPSSAPTLLSPDFIFLHLFLFLYRDRNHFLLATGTSTWMDWNDHDN